MRYSNHSILSAVLFLLVGVLLVGCSDQAPVGPDMAEQTAPNLRLSLEQDQYDEAGNDVSVPVAIATPSAPILVPSPPPIAGCQASTVQTLAVASRSSGGLSVFGFGPELGNDGVFGPGGDSPSICQSPGGWHWISAGSYPSGGWYQLDWASPQRVCQIWIDTKTQAAECGANPNRGLHGADIQTWDGSSWVTHGSVTNATNDWGFVLAACPITTKLRLFNVGVVSGAFQASNPVLYELKVYDCNVIIIDIDIKPGSDPNSINCNNDNEVVTVAILTTDDFDATTVDHATVTFEGASETHVDKKSGEPRRHEEDVDGDGDTDLVLHFRLGETDLTCESTEGTLTGETFDGQAIEGTDAVRMVGGS